MLEVKDLRGLAASELKAQSEDISREIYKMNCELRITRKLEKPHLLREKKKDRARILTVLSEIEKV